MIIDYQGDLRRDWWGSVHGSRLSRRWRLIDSAIYDITLPPIKPNWQISPAMAMILTKYRLLLRSYWSYLAWCGCNKSTNGNFWRRRWRFQLFIVQKVYFRQKWEDSERFTNRQGTISQHDRSGPYWKYGNSLVGGRRRRRGRKGCRAWRSRWKHTLPYTSLWYGAAEPAERFSSLFQPDSGDEKELAIRPAGLRLKYEGNRELMTFKTAIR